MVIETCTISAWNAEHPAPDPDAQELIEALHEFSKKRAMRELIEYGKDCDIHGALRLPLLRACRVRPSELSRALRKVWRTAVDASKPGDRLTIEFRPASDARLVVEAARSADTQ
jgi:hypothetical protein